MSNAMNLLCLSVAASVVAALYPVAAFGENPAHGAEVHWRPASTRVFIASLCRYKGEDKPSFPLDERLDDKMAAHFQNDGVPEKNIKTLLDDQATLKNIQKEFVEFLKDSKPGDHLIAYLSGHRYSGGLYVFDGKLNWDWIFEAIEKDFKGSHAFLISDCCYSGSLVEQAKKRKTKIAYACLSSTFSQQKGWSGWRFALCLMRAFEGNPVVDLDGDGSITLNELASYSERYMAFTATGKPMFATTNDFDPKLRLSKAKGKKHDRVGELIEASWKKAWYKAEIVATDGNRFKVHYTENTKTNNDTWLTPDQIRPYRFAHFAVGERVQIQGGNDGKWYPGRVLETWESLHFCRYDGYSPDNDEWFGPDRIRQGR